MEPPISSPKGEQWQIYKMTISQGNLPSPQLQCSCPVVSYRFSLARLVRTLLCRKDCASAFPEWCLQRASRSRGLGSLSCRASTCISFQKRGCFHRQRLHHMGNHRALWERTKICITPKCIISPIPLFQKILLSISDSSRDGAWSVISLHRLSLWMWPQKDRHIIPTHAFPLSWRPG